MYLKKEPSYINCNLQRSISKICKCEYNYFLNKKNVQGIGCGYKVTKGFKTFDLCIQVFVSRKLSKCRILKKDMIPSTFKGIKTDVIESGYFTACSLKDRVRPVQGGYSISTSQGVYVEYYGTAGCLVTNGVLKFLLSTNHTLTNNNKVSLGTKIVQPAIKYGGTEVNDTIGTLHKFIPLRFVEGEQRPINLSDCSIALLSNPNILTSQIPFIGKLKGVKSPKLNSNVKKVGSESGFTQGTITSLDVSYTAQLFDGHICFFKDQIFTSQMADRGDSGAILVNNNTFAIGLLAGRGNNLTSYCRMDIVLDQLDVHIVT